MAVSVNKEIWVVGDLRNERLFGYGLNVLAKARDLSREMGGKAGLVLLCSANDHEPKGSLAGEHLSFRAACDKAIAHGADVVYSHHHKDLAVPRADVYAPVLAEAVREARPALVLFTVTDFGRELAARTARINNAGLIAECVDLRITEGRFVAKCPSWGGEIIADNTFSDGSQTGFATVHPHAFQAIEIQGGQGVIKSRPVEKLEVSERLKLLSRSSESFDRRKLEEADVVVVGGAGLGNADDFGLARELAAALGGEVGATRPPVLQHWVDEERLIGQTGKTVRPDLLFTIGTSGAIQYTAGIMEAKTIVAINRDRESPIFEVADIGVVADAKTFLPALTAKVKQAVMRNLADVLHQAERADARVGFGPKIRNLREAQDWSIEALAQAVGESPEFIEQVENDDITPSVSFLLRFASALKVNPGTFLNKEEKTMIRDQRAREFIKRTENYSYETLSPGAEHNHLRAFMITIEPKQAHKPVAYKHAGEEFIFVMEGDLMLTLSNKAHQLKPGDSIHFNSDTPHKLKSTSNEMTRCLVVLYTP